MHFVRVAVFGLCACLPVVGVAQAPSPPPGDSLGIVALEPFMGSWVTEKLEGSNGDRFRFGYRLEWVDRYRTVAKMTISQVLADGSERVMAEGFKGWDVATQTTFFHAYYILGRRADKGRVYRTNDSTVVTAYTGYTNQGGRSLIRDEAVLLAPNRMLTITYIQQDGQWQEARRDAWTRKRG